MVEIRKYYYRVLKVFEARYCLALQMIPMTLEAFAQTVVMCVFHERFSCMIIPRKF